MEDKKIKMLVNHAEYVSRESQIDIRSTSTKKESSRILDKYEFFYVISGTAEHEINDEKHTLFVGKCLFCFPNSKHSFSAKETVLQRNISINQELFDKLQSISNISRETIDNMINSNNNLASLSFSEIMHVENLVQQYFHQRTSISNDPNKISCICLEILFCLLNKFLSKNTQNNRKPSIIEQIISYIETPEGIKGGITYLVEKLHYTESYIYHIFKKHMGVSLIKFINIKKLQNIEYYLRATDYPLRIIADIVGIESLSYMNTIFKKEYSFSPSLYRKIHANSSNLISKNNF